MTAVFMMAAHPQRPGPGLVCHSDAATNMPPTPTAKQLSGMNAIPSMSHTACCYDNDPMESFFHTLKANSSTSDDGGPGTKLAATYSRTSRLLQSAAHPFGLRLHHARASRTESELNPCLRNPGRIMAAE